MSTTASTVTRATSGNAARVAIFLATRLALALITLWLLSVLVFAGGQLLPGDIGRAILGPLADPRAVAALNHQLGADRPLFTQYTQWITHLMHGDMGTSYAFREPVAPFIGSALANSAKLGLLAFIIVVPLGIAGGVWAALHEGRWIDRMISITGLSATVVPEFVSSIVLILVFGVWLQWLPIEATAPAGAGVLEQLRHLILPVLPLVFIFFGYIARMARVGTVEALDADYTRTAILKGLPPHVVIFRHVLRNALLPTITVAATQLGYMIGGLVVVETLFHYDGIGSLIYSAAKAKDFPMLEAGVLTVGVVYTVANFIADALHVTLNPRLRVRSAE
ncbi:ABC transporter permease [Paraburkholderia rhizosphaerae]|uniref:Peptide/nickel transport system permease protein n=1 Tax=Paraburkholderia rhizosphaerae TaxID=480658 RepID=A0A4V3HCI3_9BURK|nr:ABC transporter permease [Paraburkholderia rhizosphaerae]TDY37284.1 peptide/nickel transport system permease protein [Paraburkholderia rhizosphaerae]